jgi:site-specific recombinase XerD
MRNEMPIHADLDSIDIRDVDLEFIRPITSSDIFDFLSYLANDRAINQNSLSPDYGIEPAARARKLSAIKSFYKYLTVRTKQLTENPVADLEYPKLRKSLPKYLTFSQSSALLQAVSGQNQKRDYAILMLFLNCGIRRSELVGLNISDVYEDRIRVLGKGNKERFVYFGSACRKAIDAYLPIRNKQVLSDNRALFGSRDSNRISVTAVHRLVKKALLQAGLDASQYSAHKLRHTAATMMLSGGVDVKTVQEVLGHENLNTTQIYTHIENTELKIAAEANPLSKLDFTDTEEES